MWIIIRRKHLDFSLANLHTVISPHASDPHFCNLRVNLYSRHQAGSLQSNTRLNHTVTMGVSNNNTNLGQLCSQV